MSKNKESIYIDGKEYRYLPTDKLKDISFYPENELSKKINRITYEGSGNSFLDISKFADAYAHLISEKIKKSDIRRGYNPRRNNSGTVRNKRTA